LHFSAGEQTQGLARLVNWPGMSGFARKLRRRAFDNRFEKLVDVTNTVFELTQQSLGLDDEQMATAENSEGELGDVVLARTFEFFELIEGGVTPDISQRRVELEARNGVGFLERVAAMGTPASAFLDRIRYSSAKFATFQRAHYTEGSRGVWRWVESSGSFGRCARRSTSRRVSVTGYVPAPASSRATVARSKSFSFGAGDAFASATSRTAIRTSRSSATTERSNARRMRATERIHPGIVPG